MNAATIEPEIELPKGEHAELKLSGNDFAQRQKAAAEKAEAENPEVKNTDPEKKEPERKEDATEKKDEVTAAKPEEKGKGKTPLDVATAKDENKEPPVDEVIAELLKSEPPANASASSKANHAAMRKGLERANATIKTLSTQLEETKSKTAVAPEEIQERLKAAETALQERDALIERVAFERSPRFQKFITEGEAELTAAKSYLEGSDINSNVIDLAAKTVGPKRVSLLTESGMDASTVAAVTSHLARNDAINREREAAQANWKTTHAEWIAEQQKAADTKAAQVRSNEEKVFNSVGEELAQKLAPFQKADDNPDWNAGVDSRFARAKEFFEGKKSLKETSELVFKGLACDVYKDAFEDLRTKYNDLVEEMGRIKAARPGAADSSVDTVAPVTSGDPMKIAGDAFEANRAKRRE